MSMKIPEDIEFVKAAGIGADGKINIFGSEYTVVVRTEEQEPKLKICEASGLAELYSGEIIIATGYEDEPKTWKNVENYKRKVLRHELFHAIFHELGQVRYCEDESLIDILAVNWTKIRDIIEQAERISLEPEGKDG